MACPTPSTSCPSCSDTPLAIATSVITFLTFLYAISVGLIYYYGLAKSSPREMQKFAEALIGSLNEFKTLVEELRGFGPDTNVDPNEDQIGHGTRTELNYIRDQLQYQIESPQTFKLSIDEGWFKRKGRLNYLLIRDELQQKVVEKDRLMTDFRHIHQRVLKMQSDKVEKERWEKQDEMLELIRAARAEDAKVQDIYRKEQGTIQLEQVQMLESILRRVIRLEASERTSTQDRTSISDPPPE